MPLKKLLKGGWWEAFTKDSDLVQQVREAYFRMNQPEFDCEFLCDHTNLFQEMIPSPGLLDSEIYKKSRKSGPDRRTFSKPMMHWSFCWRVCSSFTPCPLQNCPRSWAWKGSSPRCPLPLCWVKLLSLVWERRPKWRNSGQPLAKKALQAGASLWWMSLSSLQRLYSIIAEAASSPGESNAKEEDGGPDGVPTLGLTSPNCPLWPKHYPPQQHWCEHLETHFQSLLLSSIYASFSHYVYHVYHSLCKHFHK